MYSRRDFGKLALAGIPLSPFISSAFPKINSKVQGVQLGTQSYSFRDRPLDAAIKAMIEIGLGDCELFSPHVENGGIPVGGLPQGRGQDPAVREALRKWRLTVPLEEFKTVRKKFDDAGINLYAYNLSFREDFTDEEIDRGFLMAQTLGVKIITASSTVSAAKRVAPFADKHKITVAMHGHSDLKDPNQFAKPESFAQALAMSKYFAINLDIGHFTAANYDPVDFIKSHHEHIVLLHLKDRKKDEGLNTPWGQGDTPIKAVLQLLKKEKYPIPAFIEYEYKGTDDAVVEVKRCFQYCKDALA
jgi:sugar phosphate isomerase/epimerase